MLRLITGRARSGKTKYLMEQIREHINNSESEILIIVPEQYSFTTENRILTDFTPKAASRIHVASFSRLAEREIERYSGKKMTRLAEAGQIILLRRAISEIADQLKCLNAVLHSPSFIDEIIRIISELKEASITPEQLLLLSENCENSSRENKLKEIALIYGAYEALNSGDYFKPGDEIRAYIELLQKNDIYKNSIVIFDAFNGFTALEEEVIYELLRQSPEVYVTLCKEKEVESTKLSFDYFMIPRQTEKRLMRIADKAGIGIAAPVELSAFTNSYSGDPLRILEHYFMKYESPSFHCEHIEESVSIKRCNDAYDEAEFIAATIAMLIREKYCSCRDIVVIANDSNEFTPILKWIFEKYGIPIFEDARRSVRYEPLIRMVEYALEAVNTSFSTESILNYLKCGLAGISHEDIAEVENYVLMWKIDKSRWKTSFTMHPRGFQEIVTMSDSLTLRKIELLRERIITPLIELRDEIEKDCDGDKYVKAIYSLLLKTNANKNLRRLSEKLINDNEPELAEQQLRTWDILMGLLDQFSTFIGKTLLNRKDFLGLYRAVVAAATMGVIPGGIDEVTVGDAERMRTDEPRVTFLVGANRTVFPSSPMESGLLNESDRQFLSENLTKISSTFEERIANEYYSAYCALASSSEHLYITYREKDSDGGALDPSIIVDEGRRILGDSCILEGGDMSRFCPDAFELKHRGFEVMAEKFDINDQIESTLKELFSTDREYADRFASLSAVAENAPPEFKDEAKAVALFGKDLVITASRAEEFYNCPFKYFCKFGMRALPKRIAELDPMQSGTVVHRVLEELLRSYSPTELLEVQASELRKLIRNILKDYLEDNMGGEREKTKRFSYLFGRLTSSLYEIVRHLARELSQSRFTPTDFELRINRDGAIQPTILEVGDGSRVSVYGVVDRVDTMKKDGKTYLRVVDYKTGTKVFSLDEVLEGLNMQLLIYLFAIWRNGAERYGEVVPSGALYVPAFMPYTAIERGATDEQLLEQKDKLLCMNGLVLDDAEVIHGMEPDVKGVFIPVHESRGELKGSLIGLERLGQLEKKINELLVGMARELHHGRIAPSPANTAARSACEFCDYKAVCRFNC